MTGRVVADAARRAHPSLDVTYVAGRLELRAHVAGLLAPGDLCLTLGAGDLTSLPDELQAEHAVVSRGLDEPAGPPGAVLDAIADALGDRRHAPRTAGGPHHLPGGRASRCSASRRTATEDLVALHGALVGGGCRRPAPRAGGGLEPPRCRRRVPRGRRPPRRRFRLGRDRRGNGAGRSGRQASRRGPTLGRGWPARPRVGRRDPRIGGRRAADERRWARLGHRRRAVSLRASSTSAPAEHREAGPGRLALGYRTSALEVRARWCSGPSSPCGRGTAPRPRGPWRTSCAGAGPTSPGVPTPARCS